MGRASMFPSHLNRWPPWGAMEEFAGFSWIHIGSHDIITEMNIQNQLIQLLILCEKMLWVTETRQLLMAPETRLLLAECGAPRQPPLYPQLERIVATAFCTPAIFNVTFPVVSTKFSTWQPSGNPKCISVYYVLLRMGLWALNGCSEGSEMLDIPTWNTVRAARNSMGWTEKKKKITWQYKCFNPPGEHFPPSTSTLMPLVSFLPLIPAPLFLCFFLFPLVLKEQN